MHLAKGVMKQRCKPTILHRSIDSTFKKCVYILMLILVLLFVSSAILCGQMATDWNYHVSSVAINLPAIQTALILSM